MIKIPIHYTIIPGLLLILHLMTAPTVCSLEMSTTLLPQNRLTHFNTDIQKKPASVRLQIETIIQFYVPPKKAKPIKKKEKKLTFKNKNMGMILARILSRKGLYPEAAKVYERLIHLFPQYLDIRADYAEVLIEYGDYEQAFFEIQEILAQNPSDLRGLRIQASLYDRINMPSWSFPVYEKLFIRFPNDTGIWFDSASQRLRTGQWQKALNALSRVLDNDPENFYALRSIHGILSERRPAFQSHLIVNDSSDDTMRVHQHYQLRCSLTEYITLKPMFDKIVIKPSTNSPVASRSIQQSSLEMDLWMSSRLTFTGLMRKYSGLGRGIESFVRLTYRRIPESEYIIGFMKNAPWYDPIQAMESEGRYDEFQAYLSKKLSHHFRLNANFLFRTYALNTVSNYGYRQSIHLDISRRLWTKPDTSISLGMDQASFSYHTDNRSVPMLLDENTYSINTYTQDQPFSRLLYFLATGYRWDTRRDLSGFSIHPGIGWLISAQSRLDASYTYSSESTGVVQGSTQTFQVNCMIVF